MPSVPNRVTGLQAAQLSVRAQLEAWRQAMGPREFAVLVDLLVRMLEAEQRRPGIRRAA
jgi:hypothetical protein